MQGITKVLKIAAVILALATGVAAGIIHVANSLDSTPAIHEDSATDPKGVYEIYNNTVVTGEQVLTAQMVYGNYESPDKGLCRIQTGETRKAYENGTGEEWSDYKKIRDEEDPSYVNPIGQFQANLVYGRDLPGTPENQELILNFPNELQWIEFRQISTRNNNKPSIIPGQVTPEPTIWTEENLSDTPDVVSLVASGTMNLWEGTKRNDITPSIQGVTITYGGVDVTNNAEVQWTDWNTEITNGEATQQKTFTVKYKGKSASVTVNLYQMITVSVSTKDTVDGHPVRVFTNHPELSSNTFSSTDDADFRFLAATGETDASKLFKQLTSDGLYFVPESGDYVVANTKQGGAYGTATASMTVGTEESRYKAFRSSSISINWRLFRVSYFNKTADEAYQNRNNEEYTDEETGLITGAKNEDAGYTSLIAQGDVVTLTCNAVADVSYRGSGVIDGLIAGLTGEQIFKKASAEEDYTGSNKEKTAVTLVAARATEPGEAKVTFTDKVTKFTATPDEKFWTLYSAFTFSIPSYNLVEDKLIERDEAYTTTDLVVKGSQSLTTTNDKKLYVEKDSSVSDQNLVVEDYTFANFTSADSQEATETAGAINGQENVYTLNCSTQYTGKDDDTNRQGREYFTAVYPDFGSRYTVQKTVHVWYPLQVEFTRPLNKDADDKSSACVGEPVILTSSQYDDVKIVLDDGEAEYLKKSGEVEGAIEKSDCNFYKDFNGLSYDGVSITSTFSSKSVAYTAEADGTVSYTVSRARTGESLPAGTSTFSTTMPSTLWNVTSAQDSNRLNNSDYTKKMQPVNDNTNRTACGDAISYKDAKGDAISPLSVAFEVYTGSSEKVVEKAAQNRNKDALVATHNGRATQNLIKTASNGAKIYVTKETTTVSSNTDTNYYAVVYKERQFKFDFADEPQTKFEALDVSGITNLVYRFDSGINSYVSGFKTFSSAVDDYNYWAHGGEEIVLKSIYDTMYYSSGAINGHKSVNVKFSVADKKVDENKASNAQNSTINDQSLTMTVDAGSLAGINSNVLLVHTQFFNRTKDVGFKAYKDLTNEIDVVEMHGASINLGTDASKYVQLQGLKDSSEWGNVGSAVEHDEAYNKSPSKLQKAYLEGANLKLVTKQSGDKIINYKIKHKDTSEVYTIGVNVHDFKAKLYNVLYDNYGYSWTIDDKTIYSKKKNVLIDKQSVLVGDVIAVAANTASFETTQHKNIEYWKASKAENYCTQEHEVDDPAGFSLDSEISTYGAIKFFQTDKMTAGDETSIKVEDDGISSYYKGKISNTCKLNVQFRENPSFWMITGSHQRTSCTSDYCVNIGNTDAHVHLNSYAFPDNKYAHSAAYDADGVNAGSGPYKGLLKKDKIPYLNVSDLAESSGPKNVLDSTSKFFVSYTRIEFTEEIYETTGFAALDEASGGADEKALIVPSGSMTPGGTSILYSVSYNVHKTNGKAIGWKIINHEGGGVEYDSGKLKDYLFVYDTQGSKKLSLRLGSVEPQTVTVPNKSKDGEVQSYRYSARMPKDAKVYTETAEGSNIRCIAIDCKKLGWFKSDVDYVDIKLTFYSYTELNRSYTFPIQLKNKGRVEVIFDGNAGTGKEVSLP